MKGFLEPKTIAVIGASSNKTKVGFSLMFNLRKFKGKVIPINLKGKPIFGKKCYKTVLDYSQKIDLALVSVPAPVVPFVLKQCIDKGIPNVIIISSGFSEVGNKEVEKKLKEMAKGKARILGPNCFGVVNPYNNFNTTFAMQTPKKGDVAFISQSGSLWSAILEYSIRTHFGFSGFVSFGNMIDVDFADCIEYFDKDPKTKVIVVYIESLHDGKGFMRAAKKCKKPIIAIKSGSSEAGKKATFSHTGSMAGTFEIYKAAFKQCGIIHVKTLTEAFDKAKFFQTTKGRRVVIITNSGGPGALVADHCAEEGLEVVPLPKNLIFNLHPAWSHNNPIDVVGDAKSDSYKHVFDVLTENKDFYDCVIVILTPQKMTDVINVAKAVVEFKKKSKKPVAAAWMTEIGKDMLEKAKIPAFFKLERAARAFIF